MLPWYTRSAAIGGRIRARECRGERERVDRADRNGRGAESSENVLEVLRERFSMVTRPPLMTVLSS
jgi:hypothetical protein